MSTYGIALPTTPMPMLMVRACLIFGTAFGLVVGYAPWTMTGTNGLTMRRSGAIPGATEDEPDDP